MRRAVERRSVSKSFRAFADVPPSAFPGSVPSCLASHMGIGFLPWWHDCATTGLKGFRPAFLFYARTSCLSRQTAANEINYLEGAGTISVVTAAPRRFR